MCRYLANGRVPIIFVDTFHLFPETHDFLHRLEVIPLVMARKRQVLPAQHAQGCASGGSSVVHCVMLVMRWLATSGAVATQYQYFALACNEWCCGYSSSLLYSAQEKYGFKARVFQAAGFASLAEYKKVHGSDLFIRDVDEYDRICKASQYRQPSNGIPCCPCAAGRIWLA